MAIKYFVETDEALIDPSCIVSIESSDDGFDVVDISLSNGRVVKFTLYDDSEGVSESPLGDKKWSSFKKYFKDAQSIRSCAVRMALEIIERLSAETWSSIKVAPISVVTDPEYADFKVETNIGE